MDNSKIERLAVAAVTNIADSIGSKLKPEIPVNDKSISFDGEIQVFSEERETVETLIGRVSVQVKGQMVNKFSKNTRSFSIPMNHLQNYYDNQGVLYFVVEVLETGETKIFYKQLLPLEIYSIIQHYGDNLGQNSRSIEMRSLEETNLYRVCGLFIKEKKKQPLTLVEQKQTLENYSVVKATSLTLTESNFHDIFEHDFFLYGEKDGVDFPLHPNMRLVTYKISRLEKVYIDGKEFELWCDCIKDKNGVTTRTYEDSLSLTYNNDGSIFKSSINTFHSLSSLLKVIPFFIELLQGHLVSFNNEDTLKVNIEKHSPKEMIENLEVHYTFLKESISIYDELQISIETVIPGNLGEIIADLDFLDKILLKKDYSKIRENLPEGNCFVNVNLGELRIVLFYKASSLQKFLNPFSDEVANIAIITKESKDKREEATNSIYILLTENLLSESINLQFNTIKNSFSKINPFTNDRLSSLTNEFCLRCIQAYDIKKNRELLELAKYIYKKNSSDEVIYLLNILQIEARLNGQLLEEETEKLIEIKYEAQDDHQILFGINTLLGEKREATYNLNKLLTTEQNHLKKFPIYTLYCSL